jgi:hypothetical protein
MAPGLGLAVCFPPQSDDGSLSLLTMIYWRIPNRRNRAATAWRFAFWHWLSRAFESVRHDSLCSSFVVLAQPKSLLAQLSLCSSHTSSFSRQQRLKHQRTP